MAPKSPVEHIRIEDILSPVASTSTSIPASSRRSQVARKSTGAKPPPKRIDEDPSRTSPRPSQYARKSTGGIPPRSENLLSPMTVKAFLEPPNTIRNEKGSVPIGISPYRRPFDAASTPDSDETDYSRAGSSDLSSARGRDPRIMQTARKSTGDIASESMQSPHPLPLSIVPTENPAPPVLCGLCPLPLQTLFVVPHPSQLIHHLLTRCQHQFHYVCYLNYITTAPPNERPRCPQCHENLLTGDRYWVHVTTNSGSKGYTDLTKDIEDRLFAARQARQQIFIDMVNTRNFKVAASLITDPEPVDINYRTPAAGFTALHFFAMINDVIGVDFLLSHGADKGATNDAGSSPADCARSNKAWDAVKRLDSHNEGSST